MNKTYLLVFTVIFTAIFVWLGFLTSVVMTKEFMPDPRLTYLDKKIDTKADKMMDEESMMEDDAMYDSEAGMEDNQ